MLVDGQLAHIHEALLAVALQQLVKVWPAAGVIAKLGQDEAKVKILHISFILQPPTVSQCRRTDASTHG